MLNLKSLVYISTYITYNHVIHYEQFDNFISKNQELVNLPLNQELTTVLSFKIMNSFNFNQTKELTSYLIKLIRRYCICEIPINPGSLF